MNSQINKKFIFSLFIFISSILIITFIIEYKLNHQPCKLCIYQRIPYFVALLLILKIFYTKGYEKNTLLILSLIFVFNAVLAFYHLGIEQGFFEESLVCTSDSLLETLSKEELLKQLKQKTISCKDVSFTLFGLSLAAINTIFSICLSFIFIRFFIKYKKI